MRTLKPLPKAFWLILGVALFLGTLVFFGRMSSTQAATDTNLSTSQNRNTLTTKDVANESLAPASDTSKTESAPTSPSTSGESSALQSDSSPSPQAITAPDPLPAKHQAIPAITRLEEKKVFLTDLLAESLQSNFDIQVKRLDVQIEGDKGRQARGAFNPKFNLDVKYENLETPQNAQDFAATGGTLDDLDKNEPRIFDEQNWRVKASFDGRIPVGTKYEIFTQLGVLENLLNKTSPLSLYTPEFQSQTGITLTQPLLRDFGTDVNLAEIRIARKNQMITNLELKALVLTTVADLISAYLDLSHSVEAVHLKDEECRLAERLIKERTELLERGVVTPRDLSRAESAYAETIEELTLARVRAAEKQTELFRLSSRNPWSEKRILLAPAPIRALPKPDLNRDVLIAEAFQFRPEYLAAKQRVEREQIKVVYARNQMWPRLDLIATYGVNGLTGASGGRSYSRAFAGQGPFWTVGAQFSFPLGNDEAIGRKNEAVRQKEESILGLQKAEREAILIIEQGLSNLDAQAERLQAMRVFSENAKLSLNSESERLEKGLATEIDMMKFRRDLSEASTREIAARSDYQKTLVRIYEATGTLLERQNIIIGTR
jgi:outer membrane protein TolC